MELKTTVKARIDIDTKTRASAALHDMGFSVSDAIRILLHCIANEKRFPIDIHNSENEPKNHQFHSLKNLKKGGGTKCPI